jgi:hypothetical protein
VTERADTTIVSRSFTIGRPQNTRTICFEVWRNRSLFDSEDLLSILCGYYSKLLNYTFDADFDPEGEAAFLAGMPEKVVVGVVADCVANNHAGIIVIRFGDLTEAVVAERQLVEKSTKMFFLRVSLPDPRTSLSASELFAASTEENESLVLSLKQIGIKSLLDASSVSVTTSMLNKTFFYRSELKEKFTPVAEALQKEIPTVVVHAKRRNVDAFCSASTKSSIAENRCRQLWESSGPLMKASQAIKNAEFMCLETQRLAERAMDAGSSSDAVHKVKRISSELAEIQKRIDEIISEAEKIEWQS